MFIFVTVHSVDAKKKKTSGAMTLEKLIKDSRDSHSPNAVCMEEMPTHRACVVCTSWPTRRDATLRTCDNGVVFFFTVKMCTDTTVTLVRMTLPFFYLCPRVHCGRMSTFMSYDKEKVLVQFPHI